MDQFIQLFANAFSALGTTARVILGAVLCLSLYLLPTGIALLRGRKNTAAIFALNFFLGWTLLGWVVALVWSLKSEA